MTDTQGDDAIMRAVTLALAEQRDYQIALYKHQMESAPPYSLQPSAEEVVNAVNEVERLVRQLQVERDAARAGLRRIETIVRRKAEDGDPLACEVDAVLDDFTDELAAHDALHADVETPAG